MSLILLVIRLLLAVIFLTSALAKLKDRAGSKQALLDFGLPPLISSPFSIVLPLAEITVAIALLLVGSAWWGAIGAIVLLLLFIGGIAVNLARGRTPDCHCFGQIHSEPIGWPTFVRNFALVMLAGFIVMHGPDNVGVSITGWLTTLTAIQWTTLIFAIFVLVLLITEGWFLIHLLRQNGRLMLRIESMEAQLLSKNANQPEATSSTPKENKGNIGLSVGTLAPAFRLADHRGKIVSLDTLLSMGKPTLLVFSDPKCGPCISLLPKIAIWQREYRNLLNIAVISRGLARNSHLNITEHNLSNILVQKDQEIADAYNVRGTPSAILVFPDGKIGSALAGGSDLISTLVEETVKTLSDELFPRTNGNRKTKDFIFDYSRPQH